jgi:hypothetical protein
MDMSDEEDPKRFDFVDYLAAHYIEAIDEDSRSTSKPLSPRQK